MNTTKMTNRIPRPTGRLNAQACRSGPFKRSGQPGRASSPGAAAPARMTREAWLLAAVEAVRPKFTTTGLPLPGRLHVSVGFGYGARAESKAVLGQCWARRASADGVNHIFVSPIEDDPAAMLITLLHELIHAADDCASGHRGMFAEAAARLGFRPPMTATPPSPELAAEVAALAQALGRFPHARLDPGARDTSPPAPPDGGATPDGGKVHSGPGKQGTRMIRLTAAGCCGYTVRTTRKWLEVGDPQCPHGTPMTADQAESARAV